MLKRQRKQNFIHNKKAAENSLPGGGVISFNTAGSLSTALLWKLSRRNFQFPRT